MARKYRIRQTGEHFSVRAASTGNATIATLDAGQVLDGVTLAAGDFVLLKDQTTGAEDGVYKINADGVAASRPTSADRAHRDLGVGRSASGAVIHVREGTANAGKAYLVYSEPGVLGTDNLTFIETDHPTKR